jgi:Na+/melibiose symporter-like transporter
MAGFSDTAAVQTDMALNWINNSYSWIPGVCTLLVAVLLIRYPINRKNYDRIMEGVEKRRRGEEVNLDEYKDIF